MYTLYYSPGTASMAVHWALLEIGVAYELRAVDLASGQQKTPEYLKLNPNGVVPTLLAEGKPYYECAALLILLAERHPHAKLAPLPGTEKRGQFLQWMLHFANSMQPAFRQWFYPVEYGSTARETEVKELARQRIEAGWERLDAHLAIHGPGVLGTEFGVSDLFATMLMRWSRNMPKPATEWPATARLATIAKSRPSWKRLCDAEGLTEWV